MAHEEAKGEIMQRADWWHLAPAEQEAAFPGGSTTFSLHLPTLRSMTQGEGLSTE